MKGPMARSPRGRRRFRVASPLDIRNWVTEHAAEEVYEELCRRIDALDAVGKPWAEGFVQGGRHLATTTLALLGRAEELPSLTPDEEGMAIRAGTANIVATYWAQHEYRRGMLLPPIMISGGPWDSLPDRIHVLDLSPDQIRRAAPKPAAPAQWAAAQRKLGEADTLPLLLGAAHGMIERFGPWAIFNPVVLAALFYWLLFAQYAPTKPEAEYAADAADSLLDAFRPNLSRRLSRTPDRLTGIQQEFSELLARARQLKELQQSQHPGRALLARAREWFGARVDGRDLRRWELMTATPIAMDVLKSQRGLSARALRDLRRLADDAEEIAAAWQRFLEYLKTRSEQDQRRITGALPLLASPRPPQSSQST